MPVLRRLADGLIGLCAAAGAVGLLGEVVVILVDVVGRAFGRPLLESQDLTTSTLVIVVFGGMALRSLELSLGARDVREGPGWRR